MAERFVEMDRFADLRTDLLDETAELNHAIPYRVDSYDERTSLMREVRRKASICDAGSTRQASI
jgi:hypothetical protein